MPTSLFTYLPGDLLYVKSHDGHAVRTFQVQEDGTPRELLADGSLVSFYSPMTVSTPLDQSWPPSPRPPAPPVDPRHPDPDPDATHVSTKVDVKSPDPRHSKLRRL